MIKKTVSFLICAGILLMAGCGETKNTSTATPAASSQAPASSPVIPECSLPESTQPAAANLLPPLLPKDPAGLDASPQNWWFGKQVDPQGRPLEAVAMQEKYNDLGLTALGPEDTAVYLTFDFGYETGYSGQIMDVLKEKNASATFFLVLSFLEQQPDTVRRMVEEGHSIGSHSITHPGAPAGVPGLPLETQAEEITAVGKALQQDYGYNCYLFRYPEGIYSEQSLAVAAQQGYHSVFWGYAYNDWSRDSQPDVAQSLQKALDAAHPGAIYLLHPQSTNTEMLGDLIEGLRAKGYEVKGL